MTIPEFADAWDVSPRTVERYVQQGGLPRVKESGRVLVRYPDAVHWMQRHIAQSVRRASPGMSRDEVRTRTHAVWAEMNDETNFDVMDDE